ncbi:MAG: glycerophosphodiester phosphodiesterase family protein [Clostridia bacterium]|nr:glycerophosphodiester phosphodiesterase family protein [Clostridia bacterium]
MNYWTQSNSNIFVAAHRGWSARFAENTMEAFRAAAELGVDQIETDVRLTKDGELVLFHDETLERVTDGSGRVADHTLKELKKLSVKGAGRIPTLCEFLELFRAYPRLTLDMELKEYPTEGREALAYDTCDRVLRLISEAGLDDRCVINTFSGRLHEYIRSTYGQKYKQHVYYPQRHLGDCALDPYSYAYCTCVFGVQEGSVTIEEVRSLNRKTGVRIWAGAYVKDEPTADLAVRMGAELITCNNPDEILAILRDKKLHR